MVTYSTSTYDKWLGGAGGGKYYQMDRQQIANRALQYIVEVTFVVGDLYVAGGIDLDVKQGTARTISAVIVNKSGGEGVMSYNATTGKFLLHNDAGVETPANQPIGPATATLLVFARE